MQNKNMKKMSPGDLVWYHSTEGSWLALIIIRHACKYPCDGTDECDYVCLWRDRTIWIKAKRLHIEFGGSN